MNRKVLVLNGAAVFFTLVVFLVLRHTDHAWLALIPMACAGALTVLFQVHKDRFNRWAESSHGYRALRLFVWRCTVLWKIPPRFVPRLRTRAGDRWRSIFRNRFFQVSVDDQGRIRINDRDGRPILKSIEYYSDTSHGKYQTLSQASVDSMPTSHGMLVTIRGTVGGERVEIRICLRNDLSQLDWEIDTTFLVDTTVRRLALAATSAVPATELYARNGIVHTGQFNQSEYWLDHEGAKFGVGKRVLWLYHVPDVSSLQVYLPANQLWINLDYFMDHPSMRIPFRQDGTARWQDTSHRVCKAGDVLRRRFTLHAGAEPALLPRLLFQPGGFLSTFVWTEHACNTALPVHRALYFGRSDIAHVGDAVAGFMHHRLPITKSVHYSNDMQESIAGQGTRFTGPMIAMSNDAEFVDLVRELAMTGRVEICLHCRDPHSSKREDLALAMKDMHEQFDCVTWIDHLWCRPDGVVTGARESCVSEGYLAGTPGFVADLFEQYGVKYFWNNTYEYWGSIQNICLNPLYCERSFPIQVIDGPGFVENLFIGHRSGCPLPIAWQTPWTMGSAYSWPSYEAESGLRPSEDWDRLFADDTLRIFADEGMIYFAHGYPTWAGDRSGCWTADESGVIRIHPLFDAVLGRMARYQSESMIWFTVVREAIDYWLKRSQVMLRVGDDESIELTNQGASSIPGFAVVLSRRCDIHGVMAPTWKSCSRGEICWFDFPAHATVKLTVGAAFQRRLAA